jgi:hypothetical protein
LTCKLGVGEAGRGKGDGCLLFDRGGQSLTRVILLWGVGCLFWAKIKRKGIGLGGLWIGLWFLAYDNTKGSGLVFSFTRTIFVIHQKLEG